nr:metal-dependent hydrolase [Gammaproteobacteria bacterium]
MDSLTQLALGAALGEAAAGKKVGSRAAVWGAICGTLPDLDVFYPFADAVAAFTYHRGYSHSVFVLTAVSPLIAWLIVKIHPGTRRHWRAWCWVAALALITHPLLDACTVYGTQLLLPFSEHPFGIANIFVIDPLYTLPLVLGVLSALVWRRRAQRAAPAKGNSMRLMATRFNHVGLAVSTAYLVCTLGLKMHAHATIEQSLARWNITPERFIVMPTPFNALLWRAVAFDGARYVETFYSLLDDAPPSEYIEYPTGHGDLGRLAETAPVRRLVWFTKGFYRVRNRGNEIWLEDIRMGLFDDFVFSFRVGVNEGGDEKLSASIEKAPRTQPSPE